MTWKGSKLLRHFFQGVLIYLAVFVCLSRVSDYKHHWSDVLSGAILGVFVAALTVSIVYITINGPLVNAYCDAIQHTATGSWIMMGKDRDIARQFWGVYILGVCIEFGCISLQFRLY